MQTKLFLGASYNSFKMSIYAQIYDENGCFQNYTVYDDLVVVQVEPNPIYSIVTRLVNNDPTFNSKIILDSGSYLDSLQVIQSISSQLNEQSYYEKNFLWYNLSSKKAFLFVCFCLE